jgi:glucokinase
MSSHYWIGVDLGGTKILAGLFDEQFQVLARNKQPTPAEQGAPAVFANIAKAVDALLAETKVDATLVRGLGMGMPGQVDPRSGMVRFAPNLNWRDLEIAPLLPKSWTWPVKLGNDVQLGTYGEFTHGAAKGARDVVGIFVGTGVGGGLILNGELYSGFNFNAGEVGHTIVHWRKGTELEAVAGRRSITARAAQMMADSPKRIRKGWKNLDPASVKSSHLAELYQKNDPVAVQLIDDAARALGSAVASAVNLLSPEMIVIGGGLAGALGESFLERIWEIAQRYTLPRATEGVRCVAASLGDDSGIFGAAAFARDHIPAA